MKSEGSILGPAWKNKRRILLNHAGWLDIGLHHLWKKTYLLVGNAGFIPRKLQHPAGLISHGNQTSHATIHL